MKNKEAAELFVAEIAVDRAMRGRQPRGIMIDGVRPSPEWQAVAEAMHEFYWGISTEYGRFLHESLNFISFVEAGCPGMHRD